MSTRPRHRSRCGQGDRRRPVGHRPDSPAGQSNDGQCVEYGPVTNRYLVPSSGPAPRPPHRLDQALDRAEQHSHHRFDHRRHPLRCPRSHLARLDAPDPDRPSQWPSFCPRRRVKRQRPLAQEALSKAVRRTRVNDVRDGCVAAASVADQLPQTELELGRSPVDCVFVRTYVDGSSNSDHDEFAEIHGSP